jgi:Asp-tRNA(Asn)/Glu-tRNA(Gln) amidotransferase B subunit
VKPQEVEALCRQVIATHPKEAQRYRSSTGVAGLGTLVGQVMTKSYGAVDHFEAAAVLMRILDETP